MISESNARSIRRHSGFTLLELMVVLFIIGALASIAVPQYAVYREKARAVQCRRDAPHYEPRTLFDVALCDMHLPGEPGIDLLGHILADYPQTAVIMVSGIDDPEVAEKALDIGVYGYVVKPFRASELTINIYRKTARYGRGRLT